MAIGEGIDVLYLRPAKQSIQWVILRWSGGIVAADTLSQRAVILEVAFDDNLIRNVNRLRCPFADRHALAKIAICASPYRLARLPQLEGISKMMPQFYLYERSLTEKF
jgi:hypothetical protein